MAEYITDKMGHVSVELKLSYEGLNYYSNRYSGVLRLAAFDPLKLDTNAVLSIEPQEPLRDHDCFDAWPHLPVEINYEGVLRTPDKSHSVTVENLYLKLYMTEL